MSEITSNQEWYNNLLFNEQHFSFQLVRRLAYTTARAADIGECISVAKKIIDDDITSWYTQWLFMANRMHTLAQEFEKEGHLISAGETLMRATNYYLAAEFYLVEKKDRQKRLDIWQNAHDSFIKAITFLYPTNAIKPVQIPYNNTTIPGYFCTAENVTQDAPLLIIHSGFDGTAIETFWSTGLPAIKRGYHCLIFEGPGQGEMIIKQNIPFRFDWEVPVNAVIDFAEQLPGVNKEKIALMGISFGGYLAPRAAAFEKRIKACIANDGVIDFSAPFYKFPQELTVLIEHDPEKFNTILTQAIESHLSGKWAFENAMWRFAQDTPASLMKYIQPHNLKEVAKKITCPTLVIDSEAESFFVGQPRLLYDILECPKTLLRFTREDTAQAHCQVGANLISTAKIFNWLDKTLET